MTAVGQEEFVRYEIAETLRADSSTALAQREHYLHGLLDYAQGLADEEPDAEIEIEVRVSLRARQLAEDEKRAYALPGRTIEGDVFELPGGSRIVNSPGIKMRRTDATRVTIEQRLAAILVNAGLAEYQDELVELRDTDRVVKVALTEMGEAEGVVNLTPDEIAERYGAS